MRSFGTNNPPDCSNSHESSGGADRLDRNRKRLVTIGTSSTHDLIVIAGQNLGTNHPRMLSALGKAKPTAPRRRGCCPRSGWFRFKDPGHGIPIADEFVQIRLGDYGIKFAGLGRLLRPRESRRPVVQSLCGFDGYRCDLLQVGFTVMDATIELR